MDNQPQAAVICRQTYWKEKEYLLSELPKDGNTYTDVYQRETGLPKAVRLFNDGQPVYVNGLRLVKF